MREVFLPEHLTPQIKELFASVWIQSFALSAVSLFEPIYLYTLGYPLYQIMLFYLGVYIIYFLLMPLGGKFVKQKGFTHGIIYGSFFLILYYVFLFQVPNHIGFLFLSMVAFALQKTFFWPGFHGDFAFFGTSHERGRELGVMQIVASLVVILGPLFGGIIIALFGFPTLFIIVVGLILVSNIPLFITKEVFIPSQLCYGDCYQELFSKENRRHFFGYAGYGEEFIWQFAWPLFAYLVLANVVQLGSLVAATIVVSSLVLLYIGRLIDKTDRKQIMKVGTVLYVLSWLSRMVMITPFGMLASDVFARTVRHPVQLPLTAGVYSRAIATQHIIKTVILFEMALVVGKIVAAAALAIVFYFWGPRWDIVFFMGALFSMLYLFLTHRTEKHI